MAEAGTVDIRKLQMVIEEIRHEFGPPPERPLLVGAILAVVANPFAGRHEPAIEGWMEALKPLGLDLARRLLAGLGVSAGEIEAYGKGAIVGADGELEHGALWHAPGGYGMRQVLGETKAIVPSAKKVGGLGTRLDLPLHHVNASYVRSHFTAFEIGVADAPRAREIVFALGMATGPRIHHRAGGLKASEISVGDGQR